jgi:hypothetical protein
MGIGKRTFISRKKGKRSPFDFLFVEFPKGESIIRIRYRVVQYLYSGYGIQIRERGSEFAGHNRVSENRVEVGTYISEEKLFETLAKHISKEEKISADSITFRWENQSLKMPLKTPPELDP